MDQFMQDAKKTLCIVQLTNELPILRARLGLSQEELAERVGLSRQTYNAIENKTRKMTWNTCMAFIALFSSNERTKRMLMNDGYSLEIFTEIIAV